MFECFSQKNFQENLQGWQIKFNLGTGELNSDNKH